MAVIEEMIAQMRSRLGEDTTSREPHNHETTRLAIRHFARGIGDTNPLWLDEEYARKTRHGTIIAPPTFVLSCGSSANIGFRGLHSFYSGGEFEFYKPIRVNDQVTPKATFLDIVEKKSQFAKRMFQSIFEVLYRNQRDEIVTRHLRYSMRFERDAAVGKGKYMHLTQHHYTEEELKAIEADYDREIIRGANPRYWEDVQVGEELTPVVKGPLTVTDVIAWLVGSGTTPFIRAHRIGLAFRRAHPGAYAANELGIPDIVERVHWENAYAQKVGVPAAYDYGPQRASWLAHLMTNWIGDDGRLKTLKFQVRQHNLIGDTTWCKGKVTGKYVKDGESIVECEIWAENQRGDVTLPGSATVVLPTRGQKS